MKRHHEKNPACLAKMTTAPVQLAAAAPPCERPLQKAGREPGGRESPGTLYRAHKRGRGRGFRSPSVVFAPLLEVGFVEPRRKAWLGAVQPSSAPVNTLLFKPVCRGDCKLVFMSL